MNFLRATRSILLSLLSASAAGRVYAEWIAHPGTVKVFGWKKHYLAQAGAGRISADQLQALGAELVDEQDTFFLLQVPNASASPRILGNIARVVEVRDELDTLRFRDIPVDARQPEPLYPSPWAKQMTLPSPARDAFVLQFATAPRQAWLEDLRSTGAAVLEGIPENGYVVLGESAKLAKLAARLPVQVLRLHQPFHKVSSQARGSAAAILEIEVSIAAVPEADDAVAFLRAISLERLPKGEATGDRIRYRVSLPTTALPQLAAFPAVIWVDLRQEPVPSGQREVHLTIGDTLVSNYGGILAPVLGNSRQWLTDRGIGSADYKNALKIAILDTGFDIGDPANVHPDFKDSVPPSGNSFITPLDYTNTQGSNADCYGHGTMVAGLICGNAGSIFSTHTTDNGSDGGFLMGLGIIPEMPLIVGRVFNYLPGVSPAGYDPWRPFSRIYGDLASRGVAIVSNSYNDPHFVYYTADAREYDGLVRSASGLNGGPQMAIYFSAGNNEAPLNQNRVSTPATAKNVIAVGGSENYNLSTYSDPPLNPPATQGVYSDNGNEIWANESRGPTYYDGRIKPDLVAPASAIESTQSRQSTAACQTGGPVGVTIDGGTHYWSRGTSFSTPLAAGGGALLYTWFKKTTGSGPTPALLKAMQITLARDLSGTGRPPDPAQGWGKADLERAFATDGRYAWNNEEANTLLTNAGQVAYLPSGRGTSYRIKDTTKPVRVTLVWTDAPGPTGTEKVLENDLDLTVIFRGSGYGRYAFGNDFNFSTGHSNIWTDSGGTRDSLNNVEQVVFTYAEAGADHFSVEVLARVIMADGINPWPPVTPQQNFALFIENAMVNQNDAAYDSQSVSLTVAAGAQYSASLTMRNTGNTIWTEGPNNYYRLGSIAPGNPFGVRLYLISGPINPTLTGTFNLNTTAPYAAGQYPFQWQMVEDYVQIFGQATPLTSITVTPTPYIFYTLTPCRVIDTRNPPGPYGGPALPTLEPRIFVLRGQCGIPSTATAVSVNLAAVNPTGEGHVTLYPTNIAEPNVSTLNYRQGVTRANNAIVTVDTAGQITILATPSTDLVLDVNGYFQ